MSDPLTLERARAGDRRALDAILREQITGIHAALYRVLGPDSELEDLVQKTLIEVSVSLPGFRGASSLETWVHRIALRVAWGHLRSRRNVVSLEVVPEPADPTGGPAALEAKAAMGQVRRSLSRLSPERRVAFVLHDVEGFTAREIAELLSIPEGTVDGRLREARMQMRAVLVGETPSKATRTRKASAK